MAAGNKKANIEVWNQVVTRSESGSEDIKYYLRFQLKAQVKFNSNNIQIINDEMVQTDRVTFIVYKRKISYTDIIKYNNTDYTITSINPISYSNELEIICEKLNK